MITHLSVQVPVGVQGVGAHTQAGVVEGEADWRLRDGQTVVAGRYHTTVVLPYQVIPLLPLHGLGQL